MDNKKQIKGVTPEEAFIELSEKVNEVIEKLNTVCEFLKDVFGKLAGRK